MSPPAVVVFVSSRCGCNWLKTKTTAPMTTTALTIACGEGRRRMGDFMLASPAAMRRAPPGATRPAGLGALGGEGDHAVEVDGLAVALPPAGVAHRARQHAD